MVRYMIAHVLRGYEAAAVERLRSDLTTLFEVEEARKYPPHLTLLRPTRLSAPFRMALALDKLARHTRPFKVPIRGFGRFGTTVWFLDPAQLPELHHLHGRVRLMAEHASGREGTTEDAEPYFHLTLAFRDVDPPRHGRIGAYLHKQPLPIREFTCDALSLLRSESLRGTWQVVQTARFQACATP